jgi:aminoglycoside phosphotransferase (APT) family kinase protein
MAGVPVDADHDRTATLAGALAEVLGAAAVTGMRRLSGGASRETWAFDADGRPLILQRQRPGGGVSGGPGMANEPALLRAAAATGVPVPAVVADGEGGGLGRAWLVVERLEGETIPRKILRDDRFAHARSLLTAQCARALASIHAIEPADVPGLEAGDQVVQFRELLDALGEPHPAFELGFRWLDANAPPVRRDRVVHGDFRNGNLLVDHGGLRAVLDWELAHLGDPLEDLGWLCVRSWRFGAPARVGGFGALDELVATYEEATGSDVDRDALHWWEVLGTLKWGVMCMIQASTHLSGAARSVELAALGRRVCEVEHDLLLLLPGGEDPAGEASDGGRHDAAGSATGDAAATAPAAGLHDAPTASQLVEAVREFLERDVMGATEGRVRFHARVATNVLGMVERELAAGPSLAAAHAARLEGLGVASDAELAAAIRSGGLDDRWSEVTAVVSAAVSDKLAVANPGYDARG